jgi:anti-anti-sigma regulatory factor
MDSGGLRAVIQACMDLGDRGVLRLVNPSGQVRKLLDTTGVVATCTNLRVLDV